MRKLAVAGATTGAEAIEAAHALEAAGRGETAALSAVPVRLRSVHARMAFRAGAAGLLAAALAVSPATGPAEKAHAAGTVTVTPLSMPFGSDAGGDAHAINDRGDIIGWTKLKWWTDTVQYTYSPEYWGPTGRQVNLDVPFTLGNTASVLNRNGVIGGRSGGEAAAWIDLKVTRLAPLACLGQSGCETSVVSINDNDQIAVQRTYPYAGAFRGQAAVWQGGSLSPWIDLGLNGKVTAMNTAGTLVGERYDGSATKAFALAGGAMTDLPSSGWASARPMGINDQGQILGVVNNPGSDGSLSITHAVIWQNGQMTDLGTLGGTNTKVAGVHSLNDRGQVVGTSDRADGTHRAFLWQDGRMTELGVADQPAPRADTSATAINEQGQVIGYGYPSAEGNSAGFLWQSGTVTWFPSFVYARAINEAGEMAGTEYGVILQNEGSSRPVRITVSS